MMDDFFTNTDPEKAVHDDIPPLETGTDAIPKTKSKVKKTISGNDFQTSKKSLKEKQVKALLVRKPVKKVNYFDVLLDSQEDANVEENVIVKEVLKATVTVPEKKKVSKKAKKKAARQNNTSFTLPIPTPLFAVLIVILAYLLTFMHDFIYPTSDEPPLVAEEATHLMIGSVNFIAPTTGAVISDSRVLKWDISDVSDMGEEHQFARISKCELYLNDQLLYSDIVRLALASTTKMQFNFDEPQLPGRYNATVTMVVPLPNGEQMTLFDTCVYTVMEPFHRPALKITSPTAGSALMEGPIEIHFEEFGFEKDDTKKFITVELNGSNYTISGEPNSITMNGLLPGTHHVILSVARSNGITSTASVEFHVKDALDFTTFTSKELRQRLDSDANSIEEDLLISEVLEERFVKATLALQQQDGDDA